MPMMEKSNNTKIPSTEPINILEIKMLFYVKKITDEGINNELSS